jgi:hypothetical protein
MKNIKLITVSSVLFSLFLFCFLPASGIFAQLVTLSITPPLLETIIKPGKSILIAYKIENLGDPAIIKTKVLPFEPRDNLGNVRIKDEFSGPVRFSLDNANIQLGQPFFLKTRTSQQILLRIRVPEGAPEGDYYYTLLAETEPPPTSGGMTTSRARASVGSNILITVTESGNIENKGRFSLFDVLSPIRFSLFGRSIRVFDSLDKIPVIAIVENTGRNLIKPKGEIILKGNFGEKARYEIIPKNIISHSQRVLSAAPSIEPDCDNGNKAGYCQQQPSLILSGFFIGRYHLSTKVHFNESDPGIYASASFVALPLKFMIALVAVVALTFFIVKKFKDKEKE